MQIRSEVEQLQQKLRELKKELAMNLAGRENPDIKRLGPKAFVISSSKLSPDLNLSPRYYDHVWQVEQLLSELDGKALESIIPFLVKSCEHKYFYRGGEKIPLAPPVCEKINALL